jgi:hypothetical protein
MLLSCPALIISKSEHHEYRQCAALCKISWLRPGMEKKIMPISNRILVRLVSALNFLTKFFQMGRWSRRVRSRRSYCLWRFHLCIYHTERSRDLNLIMIRPMYPTNKSAVSQQTLNRATLRSRNIKVKLRNITNLTSDFILPMSCTGFI